MAFQLLVSVIDEKTTKCYGTHKSQDNNKMLANEHPIEFIINIFTNTLQIYMF